MKFIYVLVSLFLMSCAQANVNNETVIHGVQIQNNQLRVLVTSTGCTTPASFQLNWQKNGLQLVKVKPDHCRRLAHKIWLEFELPEGKSSVRLLNPIRQ